MHHHNNNDNKTVPHMMYAFCICYQAKYIILSMKICIKFINRNTQCKKKRISCGLNIVLFTLKVFHKWKLKLHFCIYFNAWQFCIYGIVYWNGAVNILHLHFPIMTMESFHVRPFFITMCHYRKILQLAKKKPSNNFFAFVSTKWIANNGWLINENESLTHTHKMHNRKILLSLFIVALVTSNTVII